MVLGIETCTRAGSLALLLNDEIVASRSGDASVSHSGTLLSGIQHILGEQRLTLEQIDLFSVAVGPGSFTGLRIGIGTAKAFCRTLSKPCAGIPTLHAIAHYCGPSDYTVALLPAGRGEVFAQAFQVTESGDVLTRSGASFISPRKLLEEVAHLPSILWAGEGAIVYSDLLAEQAKQCGVEFRKSVTSIDSKSPEGWVMFDFQLIIAESVARMGLKAMKAGNTCAADQLRAIYVRPSDAELKESFKL